VPNSISFSFSLILLAASILRCPCHHVKLSSILMLKSIFSLPPFVRFPHISRTLFFSTLFYLLHSIQSRSLESLLYPSLRFNFPFLFLSLSSSFVSLFITISHSFLFSSLLLLSSIFSLLFSSLLLLSSILSPSLQAMRIEYLVLASLPLAMPCALGPGMHS
jgi:hypothetical protein